MCLTAGTVLCLSPGLARLEEEGKALDPAAGRALQNHSWSVTLVALRGEFLLLQYVIDTELCLCTGSSHPVSLCAGLGQVGHLLQLAWKLIVNRRSSCQALPCRQSLVSPISQNQCGV